MNSRKLRRVLRNVNCDFSLPAFSHGYGPREFDLLNLSTFLSGLVAVLVGFTSAIAILFQAANAMSMTHEQTSSMIAALCLGAGALSIYFSLRYRQPCLMAFSTTGAAFLATLPRGQMRLGELTGAFVVCGVLIFIAGLTGLFERSLKKIPTQTASAMLAGILIRFGVETFHALKSQFSLTALMLLAYFLVRRFRPRLSVFAALATGVAAAFAQGLLHPTEAAVTFTSAVWTRPELTLSSFLGVTLPLFIVTMASQNLPGVTIIRSAGYDPPVSKMIAGSGLATAVLGPFGGFGINFAAITAAIVMGSDSHPDPRERYRASVAAGVLFVLLALAAEPVSRMFLSLPTELIAALAGIALFATIANGLASAFTSANGREAACTTFLVTASGVSFFGIGSAFWGLMFGIVVQAILARETSTSSKS